MSNTTKFLANKGIKYFKIDSRYVDVGKKAKFPIGSQVFYDSPDQYNTDFIQSDQVRSITIISPKIDYNGDSYYFIHLVKTDGSERYGCVFSYALIQIGGVLRKLKSFVYQGLQSLFRNEVIA